MSKNIYNLYADWFSIGNDFFVRKLQVPFRTDKNDFRLTPTGRARTENSQYEAWEQACRQRWRALNLVIKAKLEAVECGISVFEDEFMSNIVLPGGQTVGDFMKPQIAQAYISGEMPKLLPMLEGGGSDA